MTYTETVTKSGETHTGALTDAQALNLVRRARRLGYPVTVAKDGTITITRTRPVFGNTDGETREQRTVVILTPAAEQARPTKTQYEDLERIAAAKGHARMREGRIVCGVWGIPPAAAKRLLDRGLAVATGGDGRVELGIAGLLAMARYEHRTWTSAGSQEVSGGFEHYHPLTGLRVPAYGYFASAYCTCRGLRHTDTDRAAAQRAARLHLEGELTASLAAILP